MRAATATRGPLPKRSGTHLGHKTKAEEAQVTVAVKRGRVGPPKPDREHWHPTATRFFRAVLASGQAEFYDATDWALAYYVAQEMSRSLQQPVGPYTYRDHDGKLVVGYHDWNPAGLKTVMAAAESLLSTEASRRRARIEVQRVPHGLPAPGEKPKELSDYRTRLASTTAPKPAAAAPAARKARTRRPATA